MLEAVDNSTRAHLFENSASGIMTISCGPFICIGHHDKVTGGGIRVPLHPERKSVAVNQGLAAAAPFGGVLAKLPGSLGQVLENQAGLAESEAMLGTRRILKNKVPISRSFIIDLKLVKIGGPS